MAAPSASSSASSGSGGLVLRPFRATRPAADGPDLAGLLCPPYDVIDAATRAELLAADPDNFVAIVLPDPTPDGYAAAADLLARRVESGVYGVDAAEALYVYEIASSGGHVTRGLVGAVELRDPEDGVILPHENTMAGPVADRLALMTATDADLEPIYLLYDGGGAASDVVSRADERAPLAQTTTADGITHRLWAITDPAVLETIRDDLTRRRAVIADGHHRYATYRERQRQRTAGTGAGAWDFGLALVVDSTTYGPQVHPIHRVVANLSLHDAVDRLRDRSEVVELVGADLDHLSRHAIEGLGPDGPFAVILTDGASAVLIRDAHHRLRQGVGGSGGSDALSRLDVTVLHRAVIGDAWGVPDDVDHVGYAHTVNEAVASAQSAHGIAVLVRATPAAAVAAVAAAGARMPRKSTLFTPKPASGLFVRRLRDDHEVTA